MAAGLANEAPSFGALLKRYRLAAGLTHESLAERASLSARAISDLERGISRVPRQETVALLADALRLSADERTALAAAAQPRPGGRVHGEHGEDIRHNLPVALTSFVGREREVPEIMRLLHRSGPDTPPEARQRSPQPRTDARPAAPRLVTLTGVGGCGKTRLALEVAARLVDAFPDGAWFVDLAPLAGEEFVPQAALGALGLREVPARPALDTLANFLRPRTLLLVLDNCEHLVGACARLVDTLLRACPGLHILGTSRELLGVAGEVAWHVPSLSLPDPQPAATALVGDTTAAVEAVAQSEAVRLFVERAHLVQPAFAVTAANAPALVQLCRRLDGIPLAIELAAARLRGLAVEQVVARLDDRFRLLTGGSRTALRRQQTLRATVDWSYDLLSADEQALLRRLSVFAGGWTLEAAEAVGTGLPDVLGLLLQLVDKSLVLVDGADSGGAEQRYRLLETIRQYAAERLLDAGEASAARDRHGDYFLAWAERAEPEVVAYDQLVWLARLEADHDNLRTALEWSQGDGSDRELRLAAALAHFWVLRGYGEEGRTRLHGALERGSRAPTRARMVALDWLGFLELMHGDSGLALPLLQEAIEVAREAGDGLVLARALRHLALWHVPVGAPEFVGAGAIGGDPSPEACHLFERALAAARAAGDGREIGYSLSALGWLRFTQGDGPGGTRLLVDARQLLREVGDRDALSNSLRMAGDLALAQGDRAAARSLFEEALAAAREIGQRVTMHLSLTWLGHVARAEGDLAAARSRYVEALLVARDVGDRMPIRIGLRALGGWCVAAGFLAQAVRLFGAEAAARAASRLSALPTAAPTPMAVAPPKLVSVEGSVAPLAQVDHHADDVAAAQASLGAAAFQTAWAAGAAMTLDEAVVYALGVAAADAPPEGEGPPVTT